MNGGTIHRAPRVVPTSPIAPPVEIKAPPLKPDGSHVLTRALQVSTPVVGGATGLMYVIARPAGIAMVIMIGAAAFAMVGSGAGAVASSRQQKRQRQISILRYRAHLEQREAELVTLAAMRREYERSVFVAPGDLSGLTRQRRVWERVPGDADFLSVRIGTGSAALNMPVRIQSGEVLDSELEPELLDEARMLLQRFATVDDAAIGISLGDDPVVAIAGDRERARGLVRSLVSQLAVLQSPTHLRFVVVTGDSGAADSWEWMKWLPHARERVVDDVGRIRLGLVSVAGPDDCDDILREALQDRLERVTPVKPGERRDPSQQEAQIVVIVDGWQPGNPLARNRFLRQAIDEGASAAISVICLVDRDEDVAPGTRVRVSLRTRTATLQRFAGPSVAPQPVAVEDLGADDTVALARALAPLRPADAPPPRRRSGGVVRLIDALRIDRPDAFDVAAAWRHGETQTGNLHVPLGTELAGGAEIALDLRDAAFGGMGPNGILIGAPGAGKSELLKSLVAGLAAHHSPQRLAFVLVDFKGGTAFTAFASLPHVAGMVTNLEGDPTMVLRFRDAILGELDRRQALLRDVQVSGISDYTALRERRPELPPLPHLLLVVDEFAELMTAFPDFDAFFEKVSRLGRGLGVFALLATQGLQGGLQRLERYISYRLCLRTNTLQESVMVIGSPAAGQLPPVPGQGYLQVASGGALRGFKACLVSAPLRSGGGGGLAVRRFGRGYAATVASGLAGDETDLDALVRRLSATGAAPAARVWVNPLPGALTLDTVLAGDLAPLTVPLGLGDHPHRQLQAPAHLDLSGAQGHVLVVGAPRSGRSTLLRTLITALAVTHQPEEVQFYCVDFGGGSLSAYRDAPHVGMVAGAADVDLIRRCVATLRALITGRDARFRAAGIGTVGEFRSRRASGQYDDGFGDVVLVIDNWAAATRSVDGLEEDVAALLSSGLAYAVHVVVTADRPGDIRSALRDRLTGRVQRQPLDPSDALFDLKVTRHMPSGIPGRALMAGPVPVQVALPRLDGKAETDGLEAAIRHVVEAEILPGRPAPQIRLLPDRLPLTDLPIEAFDASVGPAIGMSESDLALVHLDITARESQHLLVYGDAGSGKTSFLRAWLASEVRTRPPEAIRFLLLDVRRTLLDVVPEAYVMTHVLSAAGLPGMVDQLREELVARLPPEDVDRDTLESRSYVSGPELVLVIDDEDQLEAARVKPLALALPDAWDIKFHVVLARRPVLAPSDSLSSAVIAAGAVGIVLSERDRSALLPRPVALPRGRAQIVRKGRPPQLVQLIHPAAPISEG